MLEIILGLFILAGFWILAWLYIDVLIVRPISSIVLACRPRKRRAIRPIVHDSIYRSCKQGGTE